MQVSRPLCCNLRTITRSGDAYRRLYRWIDDRFGAGKVSSRIGLSSPARLYNPQTSLFDDIAAEHQLKPIHCVLVDESQFLTREQVHELSEVVDTLDIPVLCYGLRTDFRGELFTGSQYLLAWSDKLVELKTILLLRPQGQHGIAPRSGGASL